MCVIIRTCPSPFLPLNKLCIDRSLARTRTNASINVYAVRDAVHDAIYAMLCHALMMCSTSQTSQFDGSLHDTRAKRARGFSAAARFRGPSVLGTHRSCGLCIVPVFFFFSVLLVWAEAMRPRESRSDRLVRPKTHTPCGNSVRTCALCLS